MRHQAKPFTVELKRSRGTGGLSTVLDTRSNTRAQTTSWVSTHMGKRWGIVDFANPGGGEPDGSASAPQLEAASPIAPRPTVSRILPDLTPQDWLSQIAPEGMSAGHPERPTGRRRPADGKRAQSEPDEPQPAATRKPVLRAASETIESAPEQGKKQKPVMSSGPAPVGEPEMDQKTTKTTCGGTPARRTLRAMRKNTSVPELRAGERWKRRLPSVCW